MENRLLYISNISPKRINGSFNGTAIAAAKGLGKEFVYVANRAASTPEETKLDEEKWEIKLLHIDLSRNPFNLRQNYKAYKQLVNLIREYEIEYIHCNTPVGGILGRLAGKKCKVKKVIYQAHGFHFYKGAPKSNWLIYYPIEKWLARYTDALITINHEDFELAKAKIKLRKNGKIYYVPGVGIDTAQYGLNPAARDAKRQELGIPSDAFVMISAGELNANKNNTVILSAMEKLQNKKLHYILCGVGDKQADLQEQVNNANLQDNVHFLGYRTDVKELLSSADCFVMSSFREGLSRSIMEAMASGLPCIVSKIRGNVDLVTDDRGGFLCAPTDVEGFTEAIRKLSENPDLCAEMSRFNKEKVKKFSIPVVQKELLDIYQAIQ
ncbi:MAG: glycosyltransferase family 4 protein [Ruminococcaceae bacterium]|nr:glycosyltransferase family 4 protein [Oscillospiraceae bacterium]